MAEPISFLSAGLIYKSVVAGVGKALGKAGSEKLAAYVKARLKDDGIPANQELQRAVEGALVEAARAFALGVAAQLGDKPPLFTAMQAHFSAGKLEAQRKELGRVNGAAWVNELLDEAKPGKDGKRGIAADFLIAEGSLTKLLVETKSGGSELEKRVTKAFAQWLERHVQGAEWPACVEEFLQQGWPLEKGGRKRVTFYEAFVLFFRQKIKDMPVVRDIFLVETTSVIAEEVKALLEQAKFSDEGLHAWLDGEMSGLKEWLGPKLDTLQAIADQTNRGLHTANQRLRSVKAGVATANAGIAGVADELRSLPAKLLQGAPLVNYKKRLYDRFSPHKVIGLGANEPPDQSPARDDITDLFVLPACTQDRLSPEAMEEAMRQQGSAPSTALLPWLEKERKVVLLADPGMGKSTLIQWLVVALAKTGAAPAEAARFEKAVPFPIILRDVMPHLQRLHPDPQDWTWPRLLDVFLDHYQPDGFTEPLARPLRGEGFDLNAVLESAHAWFMVDGLDEVGSTTQREELRRVLWEGFVTHREARWLVTSRVVGYADTEVHVLEVKSTGGMELQDVGPFRILTKHTLLEGTLRMPMATLLYLAPWENRQQETFARHWFKKRLGAKEGPAFGEKFVEAVRSHTSTAVIGRVPNVLLLMALLYRYRSYLPHGRARVYHGISEAYLEQIAATAHINHRKTEMELRKKERLLAIVAMHLQAKREAQGQEQAEQEKGGKRSRKTAPSAGGEILASEAELKAWLCAEFGAANSAAAAQALRDFIHHIADSSGILLPRGQGSYAFTHLSFQEYYAACWLEEEFRRLLNERPQPAGGEGLFDEEDSGSTAPTHEEIRMTHERLAACADKVVWHEPLLFLAEKLEDRNDVQTLMKWLFAWNKNVSPPLPLNAARLLATFSVDKQVEIELVQRTKLWDRLWEAWLNAKPGYYVGELGGHPWPLDTILLGGHAYLAEVQQRLQARLGTVVVLAFSKCDGPSNLAFLTHAKSLKSLILDGWPALTDVSMLSEVSSLQQLKVYGCTELADWKPLASLANLETLEIAQCPALEDGSFLAGLASLQALSVGNCAKLEVTDELSKLSYLRNLTISDSRLRFSRKSWSATFEWVHLSDCLQLHSLDFLREQHAIKWLLIHGAPILSDLESLKDLAALRHVRLNMCPALVDISVFRGNKRLTSLNLKSCVALADIAPLTECDGLEILDLSRTAVTDLGPLLGLKKLEKLNLTGCGGLTKAKVEAFQQARPKCKVIWSPPEAEQG